MTFSDALAKHKLFSRLYVNLVRAGETSGGLDVILDRLASFLEKDLELRGKIRSAMTYPVIVFVFAVGVAYFLLTGIVPQFGQILTDLGSELPILTRFLIALSGFLRAATLPLVLLGVVLFLRLPLVLRNPSGAEGGGPRQAPPSRLRQPGPQDGGGPLLPHPSPSPLQRGEHN